MRFKMMSFINQPKGEPLIMEFRCSPKAEVLEQKLDRMMDEWGVRNAHYNQVWGLRYLVVDLKIPEHIIVQQADSGYEVALVAPIDQFDEFAAHIREGFEVQAENALHDLKMRAGLIDMVNAINNEQMDQNEEEGLIQPGTNLEEA